MRSKRNTNRICLIDADGTARLPVRVPHGSTVVYALIDAPDADRLSQWSWYLNTLGYVVRGYRSSGKVLTIRLHREVLGLTELNRQHVDHINRDKLDNRRSNLRITPRGAGGQNKSNYVGSRSLFRGVHLHKESGKWRARLQVNGRKVSVGLFKTELEAAEAVRAARLSLMPYAVD